jgi:hypothetical protein
METRKARQSEEVKIVSADSYQLDDSEVPE